MVLNSISYFSIGPLPLIAYGGIITFICLVFTAAIPILNQKGYHKIPMGWHFVMARITVALAAIHGLLGILAYF